MNIGRDTASRNFAYGRLLGGFAACAFLFGFATETAQAGRVQLPPEAAQAIEKMYGGDPDGAIAMLHTYESAHPDDPLPYTIEAEARWWKMFITGPGQAFNDQAITSAFQANWEHPTLMKSLFDTWVCLLEICAARPRGG